MKKHFEAFGLAVTFMTRLPFPCPQTPSQPVFTLALGYMPFVGLIIGLLTALCLIGSVWLCQMETLSVLLTIIFSILLTGAMHEDGLADCADGMVGGYTVDKRLEIMKDSRQGTYGVIALWAILTLELTCLTMLLRGTLLAVAVLILVSHGLGRVSILLLSTFLPYARKKDSKSGSFFTEPSKIVCFAGLLPVLLTTLILMGTYGLICLGVCLLVSLLCALYFHGKIGGITGDCLGTASKFTQVGCYLAIIFCLRFQVPLQLFVPWTRQ